ncbi:YeiH family protein [Aestuariibacter sp. A3R04]|uniref:YeiH family protein n=1 Tax=Aestuariibacter sp. A3R04 TaxID=2841571 RepID=UPI002091CA5A|nr:YeiH family protein [Aestuariibacter sp. A3R04]
MVTIPVSARFFHSVPAGLILVALLTCFSMWCASSPLCEQIGLSSLTIAIIAGALLGNTVWNRTEHFFSGGVNIAKRHLLKLGVILFGLRITFAQIGQLGWQGVLIDLFIVLSVMSLALFVGKKLLKLDLQTTVLIGAGSAFCGAAAILATESVIKGQAHKVSLAVTTVVLFGTLSMCVYPLLYTHMGLSEDAFGIYTGATIHEVAQVVAAGSAVNANVADIAVVEKMIRVMMLAPFLVMLSLFVNRDNDNKQYTPDKGKHIPWFAVFFIAMCGINSMQVLPVEVVSTLLFADNIFLTMAMAALGLHTHLAPVLKVGVKPLVLAGSLFVFLLSCGFVLCVWI